MDNNQIFQELVCYHSSSSHKSFSSNNSVHNFERNELFNPCGLGALEFSQRLSFCVSKEATNHGI